MRIAALISGGVDSAVTVHKLVEEGHDVDLFYIRIGMDDDSGDCSAEEDIEMCNLIARRYGLRLEVVPLHKEYWEHVMNVALEKARSGLTPNPDMACNRVIKFGYFEERAGKNYDLTATGHYATTLTGADGLTYLGTAVDPVKDQTDFLASITYGQLCHAMFPIGNLPKSEVRRIALEANLPNARRRDSQGICFLGNINSASAPALSSRSRLAANSANTADYGSTPSASAKDSDSAEAPGLLCGKISPTMSSTCREATIPPCNTAQSCL